MSASPTVRTADDVFNNLLAHECDYERQRHSMVPRIDWREGAAFWGSTFNYGRDLFDI